MCKEKKRKSREIEIYKLSTYISDQGYGYAKQVLDYVKTIFYDRKIYVLQTMHRHVIDWYHFIS